MKIRFNRVAIISIIVCIFVFCSTVLFSGSKYYELDDFNRVIVGESSLFDVWCIAPNNWFHVTSYGGYLEYPMQDGHRILVEFYGPGQTVGAIRIVE